MCIVILHEVKRQFFFLDATGVNSQGASSMWVGIPPGLEMVSQKRFTDEQSLGVRKI